MRRNSTPIDFAIDLASIVLPTRDRAVSLFGSIFPIGAMIGPIFGGLFVSYWTWRGVFFVNVPIGIAIVLAAWRAIPHDRVWPRPVEAGMDLPGMALLGVGLLAGMLAISSLGERGGRAAFSAFVLLAAVAIAENGTGKHAQPDRQVATAAALRNRL